ncbi:MAG: transcriptional regulator [SAR202 cluster bacterium]|nr:transcriptional regulator [SAR202 cluster bacterium]
MTPPTSDDIAGCDVLIAARPETVFSFFTDPSKMVRWNGVAASLDPRTGGEYTVDLGDGIVMAGSYIEVTPFPRIVYSFGWQGSPKVPPGSTTVEITLRREGQGTRVHLRHFGLPDEHERGLHAMGWKHYLARLVIAGAGGDAGPHVRPGM